MEQFGTEYLETGKFFIENALYMSTVFTLLLSYLRPELPL